LPGHPDDPFYFAGILKNPYLILIDLVSLGTPCQSGIPSHQLQKIHQQYIYISFAERTLFFSEKYTLFPNPLSHFLSQIRDSLYTYLMLFRLLKSHSFPFFDPLLS
jgi:hypothetical protein